MKTIQVLYERSPMKESLFARSMVLINSLFFNLKCFELKLALKVPIYVPFGTRIRGAYKGCIEIDSPYFYRGMIQLGKCEGAIGAFPFGVAELYFESNGKIIFTGKADIARGMSIAVHENGTIVFGEDFKANQNLMILCKKNITFGNHVLCGWNVTFRDHDGHEIYDNSKVLLNPDKEILVGSDVWIGANANLYKGAVIGDGSIIGGNSLVTGVVPDQSVVAGSPAKVIKQNITWQR